MYKLPLSAGTSREDADVISDTDEE